MNVKIIAVKSVANTKTNRKKKETNETEEEKSAASVKTTVY